MFRLSRKFPALLILAAAGIARGEDVQRGVQRYRELLHDINRAVVFTIANRTTSDYELDLARRAGSDVLIRGWFKWGETKPFSQLQPLAEKAHQFGALFGGGITCSALYDKENGITHAQLLDMATRGADGQLVDAWNRPGIRHGSLSSPAYLDYLFRWCREEIDAGADYLFMDENGAALSPKEGYDDRSLADFRYYLRKECPRTRGWPPADTRWHDQFKIDLRDRAVCPDGTMASFDYREYLRANRLIRNPKNNPLLPLWRQFRPWRDDRAWKTLTDRIRAYANEHHREVLISANGLARYVDLQVLGIWKKWNTKDGHIDLSENQLPYWHSLVESGRALAGKRVPVVLFHDWGMGTPPFKWLAVPPSDREVWMRTRGAEIYAAGAFFAFPVIGPFGCDSGKDGTISVIAQQAAFYKAHRDLYLNADFLTSEGLSSETPNLSLALWSIRNSNAIVLHIINRNVVNGVLNPQKNVNLAVPLDRAPSRVSLLSPDFKGERRGKARLSGGRLEVALGNLDAYTIAILRYDRPR